MSLIENTLLFTGWRVDAQRVSASVIRPPLTDLRVNLKTLRSLIGEILVNQSWDLSGGDPWNPLEDSLESPGGPRGVSRPQLENQGVSQRCACSHLLNGNLCCCGGQIAAGAAPLVKLSFTQTCLHLQQI